MADNTTSPAPGGRANSGRLNTITPPGEKPKEFTELAIERGYCTAKQIKDALDAHHRERSQEDLTVYLVRTGVLTQQQARACERALRGTTVIAGFEILEKVGQGGMGAVFRAKQISMERIVALKILPPKLAQDPVFKKRFLHEARLSAKLSHINIISGIDCGEAGGYTFFAMEFVDGKTVKQILKQRKMPCDEAAGIVLQMAEALIYAQSHNLVHRDIKPDNIMLTSAGVAKLCDLGLAKQLEKAEDASLTQAGQAVGTPHYISPEQARGEKTVDTRSDIYSLGGTFYHMLTGKTPFDAPTGASVMAMHITDAAASPCDLDPEIPVEYGLICAKMMCKAASGRYQSARDLLDDLEAARDGLPVSAAEFQGKSSCAMPKKADAVAPQMHLPMGERRILPTGRHSATGGSLSSFMAAGALIFALCAAGYWYFMQNGGGNAAVAPPVKPPDPSEKSSGKIEPPIPAPPKDTAVTPPPKNPAPPKPPDKVADPAVDPKPAVTDTVKKPAVTPDPGKAVPAEPEKAVVSSRALPPPPKEIPAPKMEWTGEMLYARFLAEMPKYTARGDLQKAHNDVRELSNKSDFSIARADVNAELADFAAATTYEQDAIKARAAAGGTVDLNEETAKKWETNKGKIIGSDPAKGLMVEILVKGNKLQLPVPASALPLADILKSARDKSMLGQMRYLSARGNYKDAAALLADAKADEKEKARWERKLKLALQGERELQAQAHFEILGKVAETKSWKTFMAMAADYEKEFSDTSAAAENMVPYQEWKSMARVALTPVEGLESTGKFSPVKWPGLNPATVELKTDAEFGNKTLLIEAEAAVAPEKTEKPPEKPVKGDPKMEKGPAEKPGEKSAKGIPGEHDKSAVMRLAAEPLDLTGKDAIVFRTRHKSDGPLKIAIGFLCGEQYLETPQASASPGGWFENTIRIDGATFKGPADDFKTYSYELPTRDKIRGLVILIYTRDAFALEVDAVQLKQDK